jgi:tRNA (adenine58-N1)-methyltransferase non-catalytic subunit
LISCRTISLGKYGSFPTNLILDRPYFLTYEVQDKQDGEDFCRLRVVPPGELYAETLNKTSSDVDEEEDTNDVATGEDVTYSLVDKESGKIVARSNRDIIDDTARQTLTMDEIEQLKRDGTDAGKDLIAKLLFSHTAIDKKTAYSLAKYKLLKTKKYIRRFSVHPFNVSNLNRWLLFERDPGKILEMRPEMLALLGSWSNTHFSDAPIPAIEDSPNSKQLAADGPIPNITSQVSGRWLAVDDTGGLLIASIAERMGILHIPNDDFDFMGNEVDVEKADTATIADTGGLKPNSSSSMGRTDGSSHDEIAIAINNTTQPVPADALGSDSIPAETKQPRRRYPPRKDDFHIPYAPTNTITMIHSNSQPNLVLLKHYSFDITNPNPTLPLHPLYSHLLPISWLQLLEPDLDTAYSTPPPSVSPDELQSWKANRRGNYHRKRRRWARTHFIVESARAGGFSGLAVAGTMDPISVLRQTLPLLAGGAPIALYSPTIEPIMQLADCFSISRRAAWVSNPPSEAVGKSVHDLEHWPGSPEFPINPTLLLGASVQTSQVKRWQVLPGRTHPIMTGRGGAIGYVFTGWRALPVEGKIEARGKFKRRKTAA